jgi:predicted dehydrogenase
VTLPSRMPASRVPDPMAAPALRWGVLGTGWIAERFVGALQRNTRQEVVAVGSRTAASAEGFADRTGVDRAHGSYADLVADPEVDVVYVATPHNLHRPHALLALDAGKHVLVEKPLALGAAEAEEIAARAAARGLFCMEALWTLFLPRYDVIRQLLDDGVLGDVRTVLADLGDWFPPDHRILRHDLAGGPLLDLGTYTVTLARWVLGDPQRVSAVGADAPSGVNGQVAAVFEHAGGRQSLMSVSILADTPNRAVVAGTRATLEVEGPFHFPGDLVLTAAGKGEVLRWAEPAVEHEALYYQAAEVARRIAAGETASPVRPLEESVATLRVIDEIRRQIGVTFAEESAPGVPV